MFIRKTSLLNPKTQQTSVNYQLVESYRTERGPRQRILLNLGTGIELDPKERKELANRIEELLGGVQSLLSYSSKIEKLAQLYAKQIQHRLSTESESQVHPTESPNLHPIDVDTIEQQDARSVGAEHLLLHMADKLQLKNTLKELGLSNKEVALGLATIIGRAIFPASERATHEWLQKRSGLGELIDFDFQTTHLDHLYRISDVLFKHKESIEKHLEQISKSVHGLTSTMVLYDLTNTYMQGQSKANSKARHGVSKEKRFDCPLVTLGLLIDEYGFIKRSSTLPGNVAEITTLQKAVLQLEVESDLFKPIIVLDAGFTSEENLEWLRKHGYRYVVSARQAAPSQELQNELVSVEAKTSEVKVAFVRTDDKEEKWLYCESKEKAAVASQMRKLFQNRFENALKQLAEGLSKPRGTKNYAKVLQRLGRLKERHKQISGCYEIFVQPSEDGLTAAHITWELIAEKLDGRLNGHYFLRTNIIDLDASSLWHLYGNLRTVEDAFRFMKSSLGMRPVYHQKETRVDAHLWITVLAYHLIKSCLHMLKAQGVNDHWETVRNTLSTRIRVTMQAKTEQGKMLHHRSTTKSKEEHNRIYKALGISSQISKVRKLLF